MLQLPLVVVRGGGDIATGVIQALHRAGFPLVVLEAPQPTAIRRSVALCEAMYEGKATVEDITCRRAQTLQESLYLQAQGLVPMLADPEGAIITQLRPFVVVDAILAKRNLGTHRGMAPAIIGLGPGFAAGQDVDIVIETMRGHNLGRLIFEGSALPNTGVPAEIGGQGVLRVVHAPAGGTLHAHKSIGNVVTLGEVLLDVGGSVVTAPFTGLLRGMIRPGLWVKKGLKVADIDPRTDIDVTTISDKARCLGGAVLQACMLLLKQKGYAP